MRRTAMTAVDTPQLDGRILRFRAGQIAGSGWRRAIAIAVLLTACGELANEGDGDETTGDESTGEAVAAVTTACILAATAASPCTIDPMHNYNDRIALLQALQARHPFPAALGGPAKDLNAGILQQTQWQFASQRHTAGWSIASPNPGWSFDGWWPSVNYRLDVWQLQALQARGEFVGVRVASEQIAPGGGPDRPPAAIVAMVQAYYNEIIRPGATLATVQKRIWDYHIAVVRQATIDWEFKRPRLPVGEQTFALNWGKGLVDFLGGINFPTDSVNIAYTQGQLLPMRLVVPNDYTLGSTLPTTVRNSVIAMKLFYETQQTLGGALFISAFRTFLAAMPLQQMVNFVVAFFTQGNNVWCWLARNAPILPAPPCQTGATPPTPVSPISGREANTYRPTITWNAPVGRAGTVGYLLEVYNAAGQLVSSQVYNCGTVTCATTTAGIIYPTGGTFWWRVRANATATLAASNWAIATFVPYAGGFQRNVISSTFQQSCARTTAGTVACWGADWASGANGDGALVDRYQAVTVQNHTFGAGQTQTGPVLSGISQVYTNTASTLTGATSCAIGPSGTVFCWGENRSFQIGQPASVRFLPKAVQIMATPTGALSGVLQLAMANSHVCALKFGGAVVCWGAGASGQLGDGNSYINTGNFNYAQQRPVQVKFAAGIGGFLSDAVAIAASAWTTCAIRATGAVVCWGSNADGALGIGANPMTTPLIAQPSTPVAIANARTIAGGASMFCATNASRQLSCWGSNNYAMLGSGLTKAQLAFSGTPRAVSPSAGVTLIATSVSIGDQHACAAHNGFAYCWGLNFGGALGNPTIPQDPFNGHPRPVVVVPSGLAQSLLANVSAGSNHTCVRYTANNAVYCWGVRTHGALGISNPGPTLVVPTANNHVRYLGSGTPVLAF
jgi:alpha-tubulin suppressor-like RCC1 family protein